MSWRSKSYDELPALSVRGPELRKALRTVIIAWMYGEVWLSFTSGSNVRVFSKMLGFSEFDFGLMAAIPYIANIGQLMASVLLERTGLRKFQFLYCSATHRLLWLAIAVIPLLLPVPSRTATIVMLSVLVVSWFMNALGSPAWMMWMGDLIPRRIRGRFFANRFQFSRMVQITSVIVLSLLLDWVTRKNPDGSVTETFAAQPVLMHTICGVFVVAALCGLMDVLFFRRVREVVSTRQDDRAAPIIQINIPRPARFGAVSGTLYGLRYAKSVCYQILVEPMIKDRLFRYYVLFGATITFGAAAPGWYFWRHCMEWYGFNNLAANFLFLVVSPVMGLFGSQLWGKILDSWGRRPALILASSMICFSILPYFFATATFPRVDWVVDTVNWVTRHVGLWFGWENWTFLDYRMPVGAYLMVTLACFIGGVGWTGVNLGQTNIMLQLAKGKGKSKYLTGSTVLISVGGVLGGVAGAMVAENLHWLQDNPICIGPFKYNNWDVNFAMSWFARLLAVFWIIKMPDPGSRPMRDLLKVFRTAAVGSITGWLFYPLRLFDRSRGDDKDDKTR